MPEEQENIGEAWRQNILIADVLQLAAGERRVLRFDPIPDSILFALVSDTGGHVAVCYGDIVNLAHEAAIPGQGSLWPNQFVVPAGHGLRVPGRTTSMTIFCVAATSDVLLQIIALTGFEKAGVEIT